MQWTIETISPEGSVICTLKNEDGLLAKLLFESPRRSKALIGDQEYNIVDKDGFFQRDVRLLRSDGALEISAKVGWSGRLWWHLLDGSKIFWDFSADFNSHRVLLSGDEEMLRFIPQCNGKKLTGCRFPGDHDKILWALFGFYLLLYDERESLESAKGWQELGAGMGAMTLELAWNSLFE